MQLFSFFVCARVWIGAAHAHGQVKNNPGARAGGGFIFSGGSR